MIGGMWVLAASDVPAAPVLILMLLGVATRRFGRRRLRGALDLYSVGCV